MSAPLELLEPVVANPEAEVRLAAERPADGRDVDALVERAFGPGRYAKVSERLREGNRLRRDLSFCAFGAGTLVGAVRQWPILVGEARGAFLGPIAVEASWRKHGVGGQLIERCCGAADAAGEAFILLVGDLSLFGPHGFERIPAGDVILPGPVNPARILVRRSGDVDMAALRGRARVPRFGHG
jgi:predicted N-acetyltransferase YhbS